MCSASSAIGKGTHGKGVVEKGTPGKSGKPPKVPAVNGGKGVSSSHGRDLTAEELFRTQSEIPTQKTSPEDVASDLTDSNADKTISKSSTAETIPASKLPVQEMRLKKSCELKEQRPAKAEKEERDRGKEEEKEERQKDKKAERLHKWVAEIMERKDALGVAACHLQVFLASGQEYTEELWDRCIAKGVQAWTMMQSATAASNVDDVATAVFTAPASCATPNVQQPAKKARIDALQDFSSDCSLLPGVQVTLNLRSLRNRAILSQ